MIYLKSIAAGVLAALLACTLSLVAVVAAVYVYVWWQIRGSGEGGIGAVSFGSEGLFLVLLVVAIVAFIAGYRRAFRRASKAAAAGRRS